MSERKLLLKNFSSLTLMQIGITLLPLLMLPYLVRVLGLERFGLVAFAQAIMAVPMIPGDFGMNLMRLGELHRFAKNRKQRRAFSELFYPERGNDPL